MTKLSKQYKRDCLLDNLFQIFLFSYIAIDFNVIIIAIIVIFNFIIIINFTVINIFIIVSCFGYSNSTFESFSMNCCRNNSSTSSDSNNFSVIYSYDRWVRRFPGDFMITSLNFKFVFVLNFKFKRGFRKFWIFNSNFTFLSLFICFNRYCSSTGFQCSEFSLRYFYYRTFIAFPDYFSFCIFYFKSSSLSLQKKN